MWDSSHRLLISIFFHNYWLLLQEIENGLRIASLGINSKMFLLCIVLYISSIKYVFLITKPKFYTLSKSCEGRNSCGNLRVFVSKVAWWSNISDSQRPRIQHRCSRGAPCVRSWVESWEKGPVVVRILSHPLFQPGSGARILICD